MDPDIWVQALGPLVDAPGHEGRRIPDRWYAEYIDEELPVELELNMRIVDDKAYCETCTVRPRPEPRPEFDGVPEEPVELPFDRIIPAVVKQALAPRGAPEPPPRDWWDASLQETRRQIAAAKRPPGASPTRITDDYLEDVAAVYRDALARNANPTDAVQQYFGFSRSTAGRHVWRARKAGKLQPTRAGVAGEIDKEGQDA
jgi:hypothetical protein